MRDDNDEARDRRSRILDNASAVFLRYGYERVGMADIAAGAGVSRTALYHYFPGKEEVLRAVVDKLHARTAGEAAAVLAASATLRTALAGLLQVKFGLILELAAKGPHGVELLDASHRLTGPATRAADEAFQAIVVQAFRRFGRSEAVDAAADTLIAAAKGLMRSGELHVSKAHFDARLGRLVEWVTGPETNADPA